MTTHKNGRNETCSYMADGASRKLWQGSDTDAESVTLGEMIEAEELIRQFCLLPPQPPFDDGGRLLSMATEASADCFARRQTKVSPRNADEKMAMRSVWQFSQRVRDYNEEARAGTVVFSSHTRTAGIADVVFKLNGSTHICVWAVGDITTPAKSKMANPFGHLVADHITMLSLRCSMLHVLYGIGGYAQSASVATPHVLWLHPCNGEWTVNVLSCRDLRREAAEMMLSLPYTEWYREWVKRCPF